MKGFALAVVVAAACAAYVPAASAKEALAKTAGCTACHTVDKKLVGPTFKEVAAKYKKDPAAPARLQDHVRKGSVGIWGKIPMTPTDATKIKDADLKALIAWILKL